MDPHLARLQREIESAIDGMTAEDLSRRDPGKWCTAEVLEHLYLTYTATTKGFGRLLDSGKSSASKPTWKNRAQAFIVVQLGYLPEGRQAPPQAQPRGIPLEKLRGEVFPAITRMDETMNRCAEKFGSRAKVLDHPFLGPFSILQWRRFHLVHGMHHVKQILRLRARASGNKP